jgi:uncharacterized protein
MIALRDLSNQSIDMKRKYSSPPVPSPCISICEMNEESGYCRGCFRSIKEISEWERYDDAEKQAVIDLLPSRRSQHC